MKDCIFCKIVKREIPCHKIHENKNFIAFLDINPVNPGHTLVISKKHIRWVWDVKNFGEYLEFTKKIAKAIQKAMDTKWIVMGVAGNDIPHAHIHLVPRFNGDGHGGFIKPENIKKISSEKLKEIKDKIKSFLFV